MKNFIDKETIIRKIITLFTDCESIIVTGSFLNEKFNDNSDIDTVLISSKINLPYSEKIELDGILHEFIFLPVNKIDSILKNDILTLKGIIFNMLSSGKIIKDTNGIASNLMEYAKYLHKSYYPFFDEQKRTSLYTKINHYLRELSSKHYDYLTRFIIINEATSLFSQCYINKHAGFIGDGKNKLSALSQLSPKLYNSLQESIKEAISDPDKMAPFLALIQSELNIKNMGREYSQRKLQAKRSGSETVKVIFPIGIVTNDFYTSHLQAGQFGLVDFSISKTTAEILIKIGSKTSYLDIVNKIAKIYHIRDKGKPRIQLLSAQLNTAEAAFRSSLSALVLGKVISAKLPFFILAIQLLQDLIDQFPVSDKDEAIDFLYQYWLPESYDQELEFDFLTLIQIRENTIRQFDRDFETQALADSDEICKIKAITNQLCSLYLEYQDSINSDNIFLHKLITSSGLHNTQKIIVMESFFSRVCAMLALSSQKAFMAYSIVKSNPLKP